TSHNDEILGIISDRVNGYTPGDPMAEGTRCGPMISASQQASVLEYIQSGIDEGASLIAGGIGVPEGLDEGYFVKPTAFADVTPDMRIWQEEIFGPVIVVTTYETEEEALALANDSIYGLSGGVWSGDDERAIRFARNMKTGQVSVNGGQFNISAPFGGYKMSGNGRELGVHGLEEFLEVKAIQR
ncbi:MAG TPA: aldehyde dehydrogenase family protein, partial [Candidatus Poseidoniales archaeon]|nr:aldehyde dehydrogenase family protein [Candidatus Poseidoniales archaeon]